MSDFGEKIDLTANIESILKRYPFSIGILREILQNSDDAKATKQTFLFDCRPHPDGKLIDQKLAPLQGPALLAYNDATFSDSDWEALQNIGRSSKKTDTSKIGKFGIGVRSCYHLTDNLEVLSGDYLVIFDPHRSLIPAGGKKWNLADISDIYSDQLLPFKHFIHEDTVSTQHFEGTIVRLPLRLDESHSRISSKVPQSGEILHLLQDFVEKELGIVMLFLSHITFIEVLVVDETGVKHIGQGSIDRRSADIYKEYSGEGISIRSSISTVRVRLYAGDGSPLDIQTDKWRILHACFSEMLCMEALQRRLGHNRDYDVLSDIKVEKLCPDSGSPVAVAFPLAEEVSSKKDGRLFTYLPLPLKTGFPCHIHALFALTDSRDHLRNSGEIVLERTRDKYVRDSNTVVRWQLMSKQGPLVEWNRVLFEEFIPRVWEVLLRDMSQNEDIWNIYDAWPPQQHRHASGESVYWQDLPSQLLSAVIEKQLPVWPVIQANAHVNTWPSTMPLTASVHDEFGSLLVVEPRTDPALLASLASAGLRIVQPPQYIYDMLEGRGNFLSPESAHAALVNVTSVDLIALDASSKDLILCYLISSKDLKLLAGIPMVPTVSGRSTSIHLNDGAGHAIRTTLLREEEITLFGHHDPSAVALHKLPDVVAHELRANGETVLNVNCLDCSRVIEYLHAQLGSALGPKSGSRVADDVLIWLYSFWSWLPSWPLADEIFNSVQALALLPTTRRDLQLVQGGIFTAKDVDHAVLDILRQFEISFLLEPFPPSALSYLGCNGRDLIKDPNNAIDLLDSAQIRSQSDLSEDAAHRLQVHLASCLAKTGRLTEERKLRLRSFPIYSLLFPVEDASHCAVESRVGSIPVDAIIHCINDTSPNLLPIIPNVVFLSVKDPGRALLEYIDLKASSRRLKEADVIHLAVQHFIEQSPVLQLAFLERLSENHNPRSTDDLKRLAQTRFIAVGAEDAFLPPEDVIDPESDIADLILPDELKLPSDCRGGIYVSMANCLRKLSLLRRKLSVGFVQDRISRIATFNTTSKDDLVGLAGRLLHHLGSASFDCSTLDIQLELAWLPTAQGLRSPRTCRDRRDHELFDRILPKLEVEIESPSLRRVLGWDQPVALDVLKQQFEAIIKEGTDAHCLYRILCELGDRIEEVRKHRNYLEELRRVTSNGRWIPISWDPVCIVTTLEANFSPNLDLVGFYRIPPELTSKSGIKSLLEEMGCVNSPSNRAIIQQLNIMAEHQPLSSERTTQATALLKALESRIMTDAEFAEITAPDVHGFMHGWNEVYFDDLGPRSHQIVDLPDNRYKLHGQITPIVAERLKIRTLSSLGLTLLDPDEDDMREDPSTRINSVLRSYSDKQAFNEFLANAVDARARSFDIVVDERGSEGQDAEFLSSHMAQFYAGPSLILHNDAQFTEEDFKGIRRIGLGGKQNNRDTIGKFGLGALTMFHFTELPVIISGHYALFLDPGKLYLPNDGANGRNALRIPLVRLRSLHPGHLRPLDGMFNFSVNAESYDETLFWLPLRTERQAGSSRLSSNVVSIPAIHRLLRSYQTMAPESLLFIPMDRISAWFRRSEDRLSRSWSASATRTTIVVEGETRCDRVVITNGDSQPHQWHVVACQSPVKDLPTEYQDLKANTVSEALKSD